MRFMHSLAAVTLATATAFAYSPTHADELNIGVIAPFTGQLSTFGTEMARGIDLYIAEHGDTVEGHKLHIIKSDVGGISPAQAKRKAQELLIQSHVKILTGFGLTPNAIAVAPVGTAFKVPMVLMNATSSSVTAKSPYMVRTSHAMQSGAVMAKWAYTHADVHRAYILVADYKPGFDFENQFRHTFTALGGKIVGAVHAPVETVDYTPYLQRVIDAKPDALFVFLPGGQPNVSFAKNITSTQFHKTQIKILGTGALTDADILGAMGDGALGMITASVYSETHASSENKAFVAAYQKAYPGQQPTLVTAAAYDGMHLIYQVLKKTGGNTDGATFVAAAEGMKWDALQGPVEIDPQTRDLIENVYLRKVERVNGQLQNTEFYVYRQVPDPGAMNGKLVYAGSGPIKP